MIGFPKRAHRSNHFRNLFIFFLAVLLYSVSVSQVRSGSLPRPEGKVILSVSGKVSNTNASDRAEFDWVMLKNLGVNSIKTVTPWTKGVAEFSGVLVRDVLNAVGATGKTVKAVALNDYAVTIPVEDFLKFPVLMARTLNGKAMSVRDKGPLWIIYPMDEYPELNGKPYHSRMIWQLKKLIIE